jgi:hypothetical protein
MDNYVNTPANNSTDFNIPVFTSLPSLINYNNEDSNEVINQKIVQINIQEIQDKEPFTVPNQNQNQNQNDFSKSKYQYLLLLLIFLIFIFLFTLFTRKK